MLSFAQVPALGGGSGVSLPAAVVKGIAASRLWREAAVYWTALAVAVGAVALVYLLLRSRHGLVLTATRDSEAAAGSLGVDNFRTKVWVYIVAAAGTGMVGALVFLTKLRISPEAGFSVVDWTANVIFIAVIGGIGTIEGSIVDVVVFFLLRALLADFGSWYLIVLGAAAVVMMLRAPQGLWGLIAERFDLRFFPVQRRLVFDPAALRLDHLKLTKADFGRLRIMEAEALTVLAERRESLRCAQDQASAPTISTASTQTASILKPAATTSRMM